MINKPTITKVPFKPFEGSVLSLFGSQDCLYVGLSIQNRHLGEKLAQEGDVKLGVISYKNALVTFWKFGKTGWIEAHCNIKAETDLKLRKAEVFSVSQEPLDIKFVIFDSSTGDILTEAQIKVSIESLETIKKYARISLNDHAVDALKAQSSYLELTQVGGAETIVNMYEPQMRSVRIGANAH